MINVIVADDHEIFREGLVKMLPESGEINIIFEAENGQEVVDYLQGDNCLPDLIILDITMPKLNGIEASQWILNNHPNIKILLLTMHNSGSIIEMAVSVGVHGFVAKDACHDQLLDAIKEVCSDKSDGFIYKSNSTPYKDSLLENKFSSKYVQGIVQLTQKERAIIRLICKEYTTKEIADELKISPYTVETHRKNIMTKTGCKNVAGLVNFAHDSGIVS